MAFLFVLATRQEAYQ